MWVSRWRIVTRPLPPAPNSGMNSVTGSSRSSRPASQSCAIATAPTGLPAGNQISSVSGVIGVPRRASPTARSATTRPRCEA